MTRSRLLSALIASALVVTTASCATSTDSQPGTGTATAAASPIVVDRTGGNVPVNDHVVLQPDGTWTATDKTGASTSGTLTAQQTAAAYAIVGSGAFASEAARPPASPRCIDAPTVTVAYNDQKVTFLDCGTADTPAQAAALLHAVQESILS